MTSARPPIGSRGCSRRFRAVSAGLAHGPLTLSLSPVAGERVAEGRVRGFEYGDLTPPKRVLFRDGPHDQVAHRGHLQRIPLIRGRAIADQDRAVFIAR